MYRDDTAVPTARQEQVSKESRMQPRFPRHPSPEAPLMSPSPVRRLVPRVLAAASLLAAALPAQQTRSVHGPEVPVVPAARREAAIAIDGKQIGRAHV